ncbi:FAD-dependent oxidoreductase [Gordonia sp. N1V]|uniref:NAD(P)/FAD-dependent oxidoreductase n=1 Tax=Gordonia sp. N1V TaxID=3034163 RepID=UPI0023E0D3D1|nr:FAD-dependent oxidoreductase [Gordonia sp. N1V]MDF3283221.1 FAD-dependent oxidoreductase [Gordonia sp. N1V]
MTTQPRSVVIIGAGHGGAGLAAQLRQSGFAGSVTMIGSEPHLPYHRPPLSKKFDGAAVEQLLRPAEFYADMAIDLRTGVSATAIDRERTTVHLDDGNEIGYDILVLATGSTPRSLPGSTVDNDSVLTLRTLDDARRLGASLSHGNNLAIVGGGYVGMEVAAVARSRGVGVTVIEREDRILARVASAELSALLTDYHRARGTEVLSRRSVAGVRTAGTIVTGIRLTDGSVIDCGTVLVGIGAVPDQSLAVDAGLVCDDGVITDDDGRTSDPSIFAIGDVARRPLDGHDESRRLESIPAATEQAARAAAVILGLQPHQHEVPWFWSDQFDLKLKIAGLSTPEARVITRRVPGKDAVSFFHLAPDDSVVAVETISAPADFMAGKKLINRRTPVNPTALADPAVPLKTIVAESGAPA